MRNSKFEKDLFNSFIKDWAEDKKEDLLNKRVKNEVKLERRLLCEDDEKSLDKDVPPGFIPVKRSKLIKTAYMANSGELTFNVKGLNRGDYDDYLKDYLGGVSIIDPEEQVKIFKNSGYSDEEINNVFDQLRDASKRFKSGAGASWTIDLPKPVKLNYTVFKRKPFGENKSLKDLLEYRHSDPAVDLAREQEENEADYPARDPNVSYEPIERWDEEGEPPKPDELELGQSIVLQDESRGGYSLSAEGKYLDKFKDFDSALAAARDWMNKKSYWPNVYYVNDHGNIETINPQTGEQTGQGWV